MYSNRSSNKCRCKCNSIGNNLRSSSSPTLRRCFLSSSQPKALERQRRIMHLLYNSKPRQVSLHQWEQAWVSSNNRKWMKWSLTSKKRRPWCSSSSHWSKRSWTNNSLALASSRIPTLTKAREPRVARHTSWKGSPPSNQRWWCTPMRTLTKLRQILEFSGRRWL